MSIVSSIRSLATTLFRRSRMEADMESELSAHIQNRADDLERSGLSREAAKRQARIEFGGYERHKEDCRQSLGVHFIETLLQDVRFGSRTLCKSPGFTLVAVLTLALGIGANTAIFSLIDSVMLRLLPVQKPQELVELLRFNPSRGGEPTAGFTNALWEQLRDDQRIFSSVFAWGSDRFDLSRGGAVHYANGIITSGGFFNALGVRPAAGRLFSTTDDQRGCPSIAVLSYGFWQDHFGGAQNAIGSTLSLNNHPFQIIGAAAPGFYGMEVGNKFDVAIPICATTSFDGKRSRLDERSWWWLRMAGRLQPGTTPEKLKAGLKVLSPQVFGGAVPLDWDSEGQNDFRRRQLVAVPAAVGVSELREQFAQPLTILMIIVGLVLLIASANLASLMFARAAGRNKEIAVRKALGASRARLVRQLLTESLLLSFAGALLGMLFARWGAALLVRYISTTQANVFLDLSLDGRVLGFTAAIAVVTAVLFGVLPALRSTGISLTAAMKGSQAEEGNRHASSRLRSGRWMVASQVAFSLVLLVVAGVFLHSLRKLITLDLGFDRSNVLLVNANVKAAGIPAAESTAIYDEIENRLRSLPGVTSAGRSSRIPISNNEWEQEIEVDTPNPPKGDDAGAYFTFISPGYFQTLRTPLLAGRNFDASDTRTSDQVAIVNETFAHKFFPNMNPVGAFFRIVDGRVGRPARPMHIVGLARDSKYESVRESISSQAFFPASQIPQDDDSEVFELRTGTRPSALASMVQSAVGQVNKGVSLEFESLEEQVDDSLVQDRLLATLSSFFGGLALLLAMVGLYGAISYLVTQRRAEFGLRMALGAPRTDVLRLVMRDVAAIFGSGAVAGVLFSLAGLRVLQKLLFGLSTHDPATLLEAILLLALVAFVAGYLPARRAMRVDPMIALRYE